MTALETTPRPRAARRARPARIRKTTGPAIVLLLPFFTLFTITLAVPVGYALVTSLLTEQRSGLGFGGTERVFAGLGNYAAALSDPGFRSGFAVLAAYCLLYIPVMVGSALVLALALDALVARGRKLFQVVLFLPHAVPAVIAAIVWAYLYTPQVSPVLRALGQAGLEVDLLSRTFVLPAIANIAVWEWTGYNVLVFFTALQALDRSLLEAARVDGAGGAAIARHIKLPLIRPAVGVVVLFTVIGSLQLFTEPVILRASTSAVTSTFTPNMYVYEAAFGRSDVGLAAAASVLLALVAGGLSFLVTRWSGRRTW